MSLSPLSPIETSDLHVSTVGDLPSKFPSTSANSGLAQHLSGPIIHTLTLASETQVTSVKVYAFTLRVTVFCVCATLACMIDSLVRVSRRDATMHEMTTHRVHNDRMRGQRQLRRRALYATCLGTSDYAVAPSPSRTYFMVDVLQGTFRFNDGVGNASPCATHSRASISIVSGS